MLLVEPPRTNYDLHFRLWNVPVRVSPWFWLMALLLSTVGVDKIDGRLMVMKIAVIFVSILVHEFGHAFAIIHYGWKPWVVLYHMGGLAMHRKDDAPDFYLSQRSSPSVQINISLAGPMAGFLLAGTVAIVVALAGEVQFVQACFSAMFGGAMFYVPAGMNLLLLNLIYFLLVINVLWGLLNLLPIFPLDGGRIAQELLMDKDPEGGFIRSLKLSIGTAIVAAIGSLFIWGLTREAFFPVLLFGGLGLMNFLNLRHFLSQGPFGGFGGPGYDDRGW